MLETPATIGKRILPNYWTKSTSLTHLANSHFGGATSKRHGHAGRGVRSIEGAGYTPRQTTSWPWRGILGGFGRLASDLHQSFSDHCNVAYKWNGKGRSLKTYRRNRQCFPIQLPPGEQDKKTRLFEELKALCDHPDPTQHPRNDWVSAKTWKLVANRTILHRTGMLWHLGGCRMKRDISNSLKDNCITRTKQVG